MIPWVELDRAPSPGGGELRLMRRGTELSIMSGSIELMNSRLSGSEEALATLACAPLRGAGRPQVLRPQVLRPQVLIGGLGMGFTLRAAMNELPASAEIVVAELVPAVVAWARGPMAALFAGSLDDPRVTVRLADVAAVIGEARRRYDAILLDVDNGPDGLVRSANDRLYSLSGLASAMAALRPGGVLAIWSAAADAVFARRLAKAGFAVEEVVVRARSNGKGPRHVIWFAGKR
jgi:spermidine synthase